MTEILPGIHVIDRLSGDDAFTTHVYLLQESGGDWTMIDSGLPGAEVKVLAYLKAQRIEPSRVKNVLVTHLHRDHVGGLNAFLAASGAKTHAHWIEAGFLRMQPPYDGPGTPPAEPVAIDHELLDGEAIDLFGGLVAYHTPGHTPGHTAYYHPGRKLLFSGDLFFGHGDGLLLTSPEYTLHTGTAQVSARRVERLPIESLLSYHGGPFLRGAHAKLRSLVHGFG